MVGAEGFELSTSCSQSKRSNQAELRPDNKLVEVTGLEPATY